MKVVVWYSKEIHENASEKFSVYGEIRNSETRRSVKESKNFHMILK